MMRTPQRLRRSARAIGVLGLRAMDPSALDLQLLGRTLLHAALVGAAAGTVGSLFFAGLELAQRWALEGIAGYIPLRAAGEMVLTRSDHAHYRPWLLCLIPALGALAGGLLTAYVAPEAQGGGGDAIIHAFHNEGGVIRRRVVWVKALASILTLGAGGSGGREGPTMQIGGAIGSTVAGYLKVGSRERRVLVIAGLAAGMAAVFRTPLGAALLAVEVLYRDDFESDALIPALLASVISYSVFISYFGESTLFGHAARYPFIPAHLPLYALMAVTVAVFASVFVWMLRRVHHLATLMPGPVWLRPGIGGLALGLAAVPIVTLLGPRIGEPGQGFGIFGGGYGAAQVAITGAPWLALGWRGAELLLLLAIVKIAATSFTVGSGGSAGDFGPSLVIGGLLGGAFGRAASLVTHDPRIDAGAFALVGMGTFYGGIAHAPLSSLVMVCELAGSYDLLVPLMLAEGIAFVLLRKRSLYPAQVPTRRDSAAHRPELIHDALEGVRVGQLMIENRPYVTFQRKTRAAEVIQLVAATGWQDIFPVLDDSGAMVGVVSAEVVRMLAADRDVEALAVVDDVMEPPLSVTVDDQLHAALEMMLRHNFRELPVTDAAGRIVGFLDEAEITKAYLAAIPRAGEKKDSGAHVVGSAIR